MSRSQPGVVCTCDRCVPMNFAQKSLRRSTLNCSATSSQSTELSTETNSFTFSAQNSTREGTSYLEPACMSAQMVASAAHDRSSTVPEYMKLMKRFSTPGSMSVMLTRCVLLSFIPLSSICLKTGDLAASITLCASTSWSPTDSFTSACQPLDSSDEMLSARQCWHVDMRSQESLDMSTSALPYSRIELPCPSHPLSPFAICEILKKSCHPLSVQLLLKVHTSSRV
mmetsp:Transcript_112206/g.317856  ORF Transcript_112206/g.317856 Transcript_112206/m.317856 type:complete len:226 (+) Transcript_112206:377-1054(+)